MTIFLSQTRTRYYSDKGFTLAELLIALAILGVIATFIIPKVLQAEQNQRKIAIFREVIASFTGAIDGGLKSGDLKSDGTNFQSYITSNMNATKICDTNSSTQGCWDSVAQGSYNSQDVQLGMLFHSGARIVGIDDNIGGGSIDLYIDWNGIEPPNTLGDDQLNVCYCVLTSCASSELNGTGSHSFGSIGPCGSAYNILPS